MRSITVPMRRLYKPAEFSSIACREFLRESAGTSDRKLAQSVLARRCEEVFEGLWTGRLRENRTLSHGAPIVIFSRKSFILPEGQIPGLERGGRLR